MDLTPYISFNGNCEEALNFYAKAIGGEIKNLMRFEGTPAANMSADKQKVLHASFQADGIVLMASDTGDGFPKETSSGMVALSINFNDVKQEEKVFNALGEGGTITMPLQDTFWGARFGMLKDKYGVSWMFNCDKK